MALFITGCSAESEQTNKDLTEDSSTSNSEISLEDIQAGTFSMSQYYESFATNERTVNLGKLEITNNGVSEHDLVSITDNLACQTYLAKAKKINLEVTNNYSEALDYRNTFTDIWGVSDVITDKTLEFMESDEFMNNPTVLSDEFYGTLTQNFFQGDYLGTCFQQQNNKFVAQPGETISYSMYFSLPDRWTENAEDWYLSINPDSFFLPEESEFRELDMIQPAIFKLDI